MRKSIILTLLLSLLALFPGLMPAQTLTSYEYWFDDDVAGRQVGTLSSTNDAVTFKADARGLSQGIHRLNFRARQSDGSYSAVSSTVFIKVAAGVGNKLEYWIDSDRSNVPILEGSLASDGEDYIFNKDLNLRAVSDGMHRLNLRPRSTSGLTSGAITTANFIKISSGTADKLEYWLDGDRSTVSIIDGTQASDGSSYVFLRDLDLKDVTPGYHRLYFRGVSSTDLIASAVSMSPIIVKSRYHHDDSTAVTVEKYGIAVDNGEMEMFDVPNPREIVTQHHIHDASRLSPGNHTVKATFWNSFNNAVSVEQAFKVIAPEEPSITLTAQQEGGLVKLHFNSVANDKGYRLYRTLSSGTPKIVDHKSGSIYPSNVNYVDNPAVGTYKYQAWMPYTDRDGNNKVLKSNEVSVTITKAQTEEEAAAQYGTITGRIVCDKNTPGSGLMVRFSNDDETVPVQGVLFTRDKMPQGTEVTLTVEGDELHEYEPVTVTVGEGVTEVTINGTLIEENQPNNYGRDLVMASDLEMINDMDATYLKFTVKNLSRDNWWYGKVRVRAIDKKKADKAHMDLNEMEYGSHNMYKGESEQLRLKGNAEDGNGSATAEVTITLKDLHLDKDKDFYLYFESVGKCGGEGYTEEVKPINPNLNYNVDLNPIVWTIPKTNGDMTVWDNEAKETFAYLALAMSCVTPGMSGLVGDLSPLVKDVLKYTGQSEATEAAKVIADWFGSTTAMEALNDPNVFNITSTIKSYMIKNVYNQHKKPLIERFWKKVGGNVANSLKASLLISEMRNIATVVNSDDLFEQTMACSKLLYAGLGTTPLAEMMYTYMIVGRSMINVVNEYANIVSGRYIVHRLKQNRVYTGGTAGRMNTAVDFKIIFKDSQGVIDFTNDNYAQQIKSICVKVAKLKARYDDDGDGVYTVELFPPATFSFTPEFKTDCIMLKTDGNGVTDGNIDDFNEIAAFYIEIHWQDESVSYIPLNKTTDGIKFSHDGTDIQDDQYDFSNTNPFVYTVTLTTATGRDHIADELYLGNNKKRE